MILEAFLNQTPNDMLILVIAGAVLVGLCIPEVDKPIAFSAKLCACVLGIVLMVIGLVGMVTG